MWNLYSNIIHIEIVKYNSWHSLFLFCWIFFNSISHPENMNHPSKQCFHYNTLKFQYFHFVLGRLKQTHKTREIAGKYVNFHQSEAKWSYIIQNRAYIPHRKRIFSWKERTVRAGRRWMKNGIPNILWNIFVSKTVVEIKVFSKSMNCLQIFFLSFCIAKTKCTPFDVCWCWLCNNNKQSEKWTKIWHLQTVIIFWYAWNFNES